jgi:hypothetical protein
LDWSELALDLITIAIIVGVSVAIIISGIVIIFRRTKKHKKTTSLVQSFIEQKAQSRAKTNKELARLEKAYAAGEIDEETLNRLKSVLVDVKGKKDDEMDVFKYVLSQKRKKAAP